MMASFALFVPRTLRAVGWQTLSLSYHYSCSDVQPDLLNAHGSPKCHAMHGSLH
jgi:hypothetical protein